MQRSRNGSTGQHFAVVVGQYQTARTKCCYVALVLSGGERFIKTVLPLEEKHRARAAAGNAVRYGHCEVIIPKFAGDVRDLESSRAEVANSASV